MWTATTIGLIALGVVVITLGMAVVAKLALYLMRRPLEARIAAQYGPDEILMQDLAANSFGLESKGVWQGRGNGGLVLTKESLHFYRFVRGADLHVPLSAITDLSLTKSHLGKATLYNLLKVQFSIDEKPDSIAWYLTDAKGWKSRIEVLIAERHAREGY